MKRTLRTLLAMAAVLCLLACCLTVSTFAAETSGKCGDNVTWELKDRVLYISGTGPMWDYTASSDMGSGTPSPWFTYLWNDVDKIVVSDGVTHISAFGFSYSSASLNDKISVKEIILPDSVTSIGDAAFFGMCRIEQISLPDGITSIPDDAFNQCYSLKSIDIPDSVTEIGGQAFYHCKNLTSVELSNKLTALKEEAFIGCSSLTSIKLPDTLISIGDRAFDGCKISSITIPASTKSFGSYIFGGNPMADYYNKTLKTVVFSEGVTSIKGGFNSLHALTDVHLPSTLTTLSTFNNCPALTEVKIPDSVTVLGGFNDCPGLTEINIPDSVTSLSGFGNTSLTEIKIPDSVTTLGGFEGCTGLTEINIPDSVTILGGFKNCTGLTEINIPDSVEFIDSEAFYCCTGLTELVIPDSVVSIAEDAFAYCIGLKKITIPVSVVSVGTRSFTGCSQDAEFNYLCGTKKEWTALVADNPYLLKAEVSIVHEWEEIKAVEPTCTKDGNSAGKVCKLCGFEETSPKVIPAKGHDFDPYEGLCTICGEPDPAYVSNPFTDVTESDWYFKPVMWAKLNNVTGGTSPTTFSPEMGCTRAQVVTFLWAANGKPDPMSMYNPFEDVDDAAWYAKPVLWAVENGITGGTSATTFSPDATCTRAQIVTFLYAAQGKPNVDTENNPFTDVADTDWYVKPVLWAAENDVTGGIGNNQFGPNNTCTRGQVVTFLFKVYENK